MTKLNHPTLFCHNLSIDDDGLIDDYCLRLKDHKRKAVEAFKALNFTTFAAGDSYNDLSMIEVADQGVILPTRTPYQRASRFGCRRNSCRAQINHSKHLIIALFFITLCSFILYYFT